MSAADVSAQAEIEENREVSGSLEKDQHYYFKMFPKKDKNKNGVRVQVKL